ncbi:MAG: long-chain fatty acid--CoA ligase [Bacteroidales bacterium]|nr:long-chain fatty acid--CoA ligase [Bacteroidales bacterium]
MNIERLFDILDFAFEKHNKKVALAGKKGGKWVTYSSEEYIENANLVSSALIKLGIKKGDKILNISVNRPEWNFVDMGIQQVGAIHVPVYPTIGEEDLRTIISETQAKIAFISGKFLVQPMKMFQKEFPCLQHIISFDNNVEVEQFRELIENGKTNFNRDEIDKIKASILPDDLASILYTSGTTTTPKGVMLSHKNHLHNILIVANTIRLDNTMKILSYLPLSHSYERMTNYVSQYLGMSIYYNENLANILANFQKVKPHILISVPLLLEKVYSGILEKGSALKGIKKHIFNWAIKLGLKYEPSKEFGWWYNAQLNLANKLVFVKWREALGGNMNKIIVGGAAVQREIYNIFWAARIPVYEGYGLTEASPLVSFNTEHQNKAGSVGITLNNLITKVAEDGELLVKGGNIMQGYYMHPELTEQTIDKDAWLHTGDIATIDDKGYITITGRKKDIFKTAAGTYVYPETVENKLKLSPFIDQVLVAGANKNHLSVIVVPNFDYVKKWAKTHDIHYESNLEMVRLPELKKAIMDDFKDYNLTAKEAHKILRLEILPEAWTIEKGEITPSMKIKRAKLIEKYSGLIEEMYSS